MIPINTDHPVTNKAIFERGISYQLDILQEEAGEVVTAISRYERKRVGREAVAEEIADVIVSMQSVIPALDIEEIVVAFVEAKIKRLEGWTDSTVRNRSVPVGCFPSKRPG